eukprot:11171109-Lingulodinium_polyedra.AAC.1
MDEAHGRQPRQRRWYRRGPLTGAARRACPWRPRWNRLEPRGLNCLGADSGAARALRGDC